VNPWDFENGKIVSYPSLFNHCVLLKPTSIPGTASKGYKCLTAGRYLESHLPFYMYTKDRPANEIVAKHGTIYVQPGPAKHFRAGYTLTSEDVRDLKAAFQHRNGYLQGMYERESRLLTQIENLKKTQKSAATSKQ
jgi:hypothetical protein